MTSSHSFYYALTNFSTGSDKNLCFSVRLIHLSEWMGAIMLSIKVREEFRGMLGKTLQATISMKRLSIENRKAKTKVIPTANKSEVYYLEEPVGNESENTQTT